MVCQVTPADAGKVRCETPGWTVDEGTTDEVGCFSLRAPTKGVVRLRAMVDGRSVATAWINLGTPQA